MYNSGFQEKLGELFAHTREERGIALEKVSYDLKIRLEYLTALEKSDFQALPPSVYARGFVKNYAKYLGLNAEKSQRMFMRENSIFEKPVDNVEEKEKNLIYKASKFQFNKKSLTGIGIGLVVFAVFLYMLTQIFIISKKPALTLESPVVADASVNPEFKFDTDKESVLVRGKIGVGNKLFINRAQIDNLGLSEFEFNGTGLALGENVYEFKTTNQFGVETALKLIVFRTEKTPPQ